MKNTLVWDYCSITRADEHWVQWVYLCCMWVGVCVNMCAYMHNVFTWDDCPPSVSVCLCVWKRERLSAWETGKNICVESWLNDFRVCQMVCCLLVFVEVRVHMCAHISETLCMHCTCLCMRLNDHSTFHKKQTPQKSPKLTSQFIVSHSTTLVQFFWFPSNLLMYCEIPKTLRIFFVDFRRFILSGISRSCVSRDSPNCACLAIFVISPKLQVSFAKEPYKRDYILQKRPMILRSLLDSLDISWFFALPHHIMYQSIYSACA